MAVKRIIGLAGDAVVPRLGSAFDALPPPPATAPPPAGLPRPRLAPAAAHPQTVPPGHVWVEGDNPALHMCLDSNPYGPVPVGLLVGRVRAVVWPFRRAGWVREEWGAGGRVAVAEGEERGRGGGGMEWR
jgi:hypothetical protein